MTTTKRKHSASVEHAIFDLRAGKPVTLKNGRQSCMLLAAEHADIHQIARLQKTLRVVPQLVLTPERAQALGIAHKKDTPVSLALADKKTLERLRNLVDPSTKILSAKALGAQLETRPTLLAACGLKLAKLAALLPAVVIYPLKPSGKRVPSSVIETADITRYANAQSTALDRISEARIPLESLHGKDALLVAFRPKAGFHEHLALIIGEPAKQKAPLVRIHSSCITGDLLGSLRCDCGGQLKLALDTIAREGHGVLVYLSQEGRGIGITAKLKAYQLQDQGMHTLEANEALGFRADERDFTPAAVILKSLGIKTVRLLTNNPEKLRQLKKAGVTVAKRMPLKVAPGPHNEPYLTAKATLAGHWL